MTLRLHGYATNLVIYFFISFKFDIFIIFSIQTMLCWKKSRQQRERFHNDTATWPAPYRHIDNTTTCIAHSSYTTLIQHLWYYSCHQLVLQWRFCGLVYHAEEVSFPSCTNNGIAFSIKFMSMLIHPLFKYLEWFGR